MNSTVPNHPRYDGWQTPDDAAPQRPSHVIAHLSDIHLTSAGVRYNGVLDADAALGRAVAVLAAAINLGRRIDAVVMSGDLTDTGDPAAYGRLAAAVATLAGPIPIFATGNHDVRTEFHAQLLGEAMRPAPSCRCTMSTGCASSCWIPPFRAPGTAIDRAHLAQLRRRTGHPRTRRQHYRAAPRPLPPPSPLLSYFALEASSRTALSAAVGGTDVRLILAGHHHLAQSAMLGSVPVAVAGSTAIRTDPLAPAGHERTFASGTFNLVEVYPDTITISVIPVDGAAQVFDLDADGCRAVISAHPIVR